MSRRVRAAWLLACVMPWLPACPERPSVSTADADPLPVEVWGTIVGDAPVTTSSAGSKSGPNGLAWRDVLSRQPLPASLPESRGTMSGVDTSPDVVLDGRAYYVTGTTLKAIDLESGAEAWSKQDLFVAGGFAGKKDDALGAVLCGFQGETGGNYRCLRGSDGSELWSATATEALGTSFDVRFFGDRVHFLRTGDYGGSHGIHVLATGARVSDVVGWRWPAGIVEAGGDVLVPGEYSNNGGFRSALLARDATTGAEKARYETRGETISHVFTDATGPVLRVGLAAGTVWLRYAAGSFTDVTATFASLEAALGNIALPASSPLMSVGPVGTDGIAWATNGLGAFANVGLCRIDVTNLTLTYCATLAPFSSSKRWQVAPNGLVAATTTSFALVDKLDGRVISAGRTVQPLFFFERWAWGNSGQWYGGR